jgi:hypothetical protein
LPLPKARRLKGLSGGLRRLRVWLADAQATEVTSLRFEVKCLTWIIRPNKD